MGFSPSEADEFENDAIAMGTHFTLTGQGSGAELEARQELTEYDSEYKEYIRRRGHALVHCRRRSRVDTPPRSPSA